MLASCTRCDAVASSIAPWRLVAQPPVTGWFDNIGSGTPYAVLYAATQPPWTIAHGQSIAKTRAIWQCAHTPAPCRPFQHPPVLACVRAQDDIKLYKYSYWHTICHYPLCLCFFAILETFVLLSISLSNQIILFAHKIQICFTHDSTRAGQTRLLSCCSCYVCTSFRLLLYFIS